ncbi:hypothetical protein [Argonema antarcticum]|uniref:hypothetical protein n=1 Tax=Argonema antarcticum TaxID=2942763 RepID=UPI00201172D0|nr:hypothetical protein [Argonema antarcticum]MCL1469271.1 hypothetical protein [Argonema antarcticum A004/B2]
MKTRKLTLEISESVYEKLAHLAELNEESIESTAIWSILSSLPYLTKKAEEFKGMMERVTPENLHGEIDFREPVGCEFR